MEVVVQKDADMSLRKRLHQWHLQSISLQMLFDIIFLVGKNISLDKHECPI